MMTMISWIGTAWVAALILYSLIDWLLEEYETRKRIRRMLDGDDANAVRLSKPCRAIGCSGTMYRHEPMEQPLPAHWEFPTYAIWVCADNAAHTEACEVPRLLRLR